MIRSAIMSASVALVLGGCADSAADLGTVSAPTLVTSRQQLTIPANASRASNLYLRRNIDAIAQGNLQAVRAHIVATNVTQPGKLRETLIGMGLDPTRITESTSPSMHPASATVILMRTTATPTRCAAALAFPDDPTPGLLNLSRCVQDSNLAAMVVDPADLVAPPKLGPTNGAYLVNGVQSWQQNRRTPLPAATTSSSTGVATSTGTSLSPATTPVNPSLNTNTSSQ
jgi:type IV pilus biogenesis protein CpaD/CtpE